MPGAHLGKGMGNQFLNDLIGADALIQVVDLSGATDENGNEGEGCDPAKDVKIVENEIASWLASIVKRHIQQVAKREDGAAALQDVLAGFKVTAGQIASAAEENFLSLVKISWNDDEILSFSRSLLKLNKPMIVAANKADKCKKGAVEGLRKKLGDVPVVGCSAAIELALMKATKAGAISYTPGADRFRIIAAKNDEQMRALGYMLKYVEENGGTGVQKLIDAVAFHLLDNIVVYPVEDENKLTDHFGNVLPDAILLKKGSAAVDLAERIHTDLAKGMLYAVDARKKMRLAKDYKLQDGDVIKIVSARK